MEKENKKPKTNQKPETIFVEKEITYYWLNSDIELTLDEKIKNIQSYIINETGRGKSEEEKDKIYKQAQDLWQDYRKELTNSKYNFYLNRPQYNFLTTLLLTKIEYDVNTVFIGIELSDLLISMKEKNNYKNDDDLILYQVTPTQLTYIYHLISTYKIKGLTKESYQFSEVLRKIGAMSKIISYYDMINKNLSEDIQTWVLTFDEDVSFDKLEQMKEEQKEEETKEEPKEE
jgi:hypothetical protein